MSELYAIMDHLLENEYNLHALLYTIDRLERSYPGEEQQELKYQLSVIRSCLTEISSGMRRSIGEMDLYLATRNGADGERTLEEPDSGGTDGGRIQ